MLAGAAVPAAPAGGFDPADLPGSLARLEQASRRATNPHSEVYLDLAMRHRPADVPALPVGEAAALLTRRLAELRPGRRAGPPFVLAVEPRPAGRARTAGTARPAAQRGLLGDRRAGPGPHRAAGRAPGRRQGHHRGGRRADPLRQPGQRSPARPRRTRSWCAACGRPGPRCSRPPSAWSTRRGSRIPRSVTPATRATRPVPRVDRPAGRRRSSRRACATWRSAPTPAVRCGFRPPTAESSGSSPATGSSRWKGSSRSRPAATTRARSPPPWPTPLTCWPPWPGLSLPTPQAPMDPRCSRSASWTPNWPTRRSRRRSATPSVPPWPRSARPGGGSRN